VIDFIEERDDIGIQDPVHLLARDSRCESVQRIVLAASLAETIREAEKVLFVDRAQNRGDSLLHDLVLNRGDTKRALAAIRFGDVNPSRWLRPVGSGMNLPVQDRKPLQKNVLVFLPRHSVHTCRCLSPQSIEALRQKLRRDVV